MVTEKLSRATLTGNNVTHLSSAPLSSQRVPLGIPIQIIKGLLTWRWGTPGSWGNLPGHIISHMVTPSTYHVNVIKMRDDMSKRVTQPKRITSPTWDPPTGLVAVACFSFLFPSFPARFLFLITQVYVKLMLYLYWIDYFRLIHSRTTFETSKIILKLFFQSTWLIIKCYSVAIHGKINKEIL